MKSTKNYFWIHLFKLTGKEPNIKDVLPIALSSIIGLTLLFLVMDYHHRVVAFKKVELEKLKTVVSTTSVIIDGDLHEKLSRQYRTRDEIKLNGQDKIYQELRDQLFVIKSSNNLTSDIYTMVYDSLAKEYEFIITSSQKPYFRHKYIKYPKDLNEIESSVCIFDDYESENGRWLSAVAPIRNSNNKLVGLIQADTRFDPFIRNAMKKLTMRAGIMILFLLPIIYAIYVYLRRLTYQFSSFQKRLILELNKIKEQRKVIIERSRRLKGANEEIRKKNNELSAALLNLKRTQQKLIESEKMVSIGTLVAGMAHEINNPLNFIKGGVSCLRLVLDKKRENLDRVQVETYFNIIESSVQRTTRIIDTLSEITHAEKQAQREVVNLKDIFESVLNTQTAMTKLSIIIDLEEVSIIAIPYELRKVFFHVISNAIDAVISEVDGQISIHDKYDRNSYSIIVKDNGAGIPEKYLSSIFDPFFTTKDPGKGEGLGLFHVKTIVGKYGGEVLVESQEMIGTTVIISFSTDLILPKDAVLDQVRKIS